MHLPFIKADSLKVHSQKGRTQGGKQSLAPPEVPRGRRPLLGICPLPGVNLPPLFENNIKCQVMFFLNLI